MGEQMSRDRLEELREKTEEYLQEHGAGRPRGHVPLSDFNRDLYLTDDEFRQLYIYLHDEGIAEKDGSNRHTYLLYCPDCRQIILHFRRKSRYTS